MQIQNYANLSAEEISALETELAGRENLQQILVWSNVVVDVVTQDEFTHDVILCWREHYFLVFDAT